MHGRSCMTIDLHALTMPGWSRRGRGCLPIHRSSRGEDDGERGGRRWLVVIVVTVVVGVVVMELVLVLMLVLVLVVLAPQAAN